MPNWKLKAYIQKVISRLPNSYSWNYFFQKYITKGLVLSEDLFEDKLSHARDHLKYFNTYHTRNISECTILELGTGWMPIVPVAYFLAGAKNIVTIDLNELLRKEETLEVINMFLQYEDKGKLSNYLTVNQKRISTLRKISSRKYTDRTSLLEDLHMNFIVCDAREVPLNNNSVHQIVSNNVLEHIHENVLSGIFTKFHNLLEDNGFMSHFIDLTDHFAHFDAKISEFNFLKFSPKQWEKYNNDVLFLNRLRFPYYQNILKDTGFKVLEDEKIYANKESITSVDIHPDFNHLSEEQLRISHCWFICTT